MKALLYLWSWATSDVLSSLDLSPLGAVRRLEQQQHCSHNCCSQVKKHNSNTFIFHRQLPSNVQMNETLLPSFDLRPVSTVLMCVYVCMWTLHTHSTWVHPGEGCNKPLFFIFYLFIYCLSALLNVRKCRKMVHPCLKKTEMKFSNTCLCPHLKFVISILVFFRLNVKLCFNKIENSKATSAAIRWRGDESRLD